MHQLHLHSQMKFRDTIQRLAFIFLLMPAIVHADPGTPTVPPAELGAYLDRLKQIFNARVIGAELYSLLAFPAITAEETKDTITEKLKKSGFGLLEKDGIVNIIDADERAIGKRPYPFSQKVKIKRGTYL